MNVSDLEDKFILSQEEVVLLHSPKKKERKERQEITENIKGNVSNKQGL